MTSMNIAGKTHAQIKGADRIFYKRKCSRYWHSLVTNALGYFCVSNSKNTLPLYPVEKLLFLFLHLGKQLLFQLLDFIDDTFLFTHKKGYLFLESETDFGIIQRCETRSRITSSHSRSGSLRSLLELLRAACFHPPPP